MKNQRRIMSILVALGRLHVCSGKLGQSIQLRTDAIQITTAEGCKALQSLTTGLQIPELVCIRSLAHQRQLQYRCRCWTLDLNTADNQIRPLA